MKNVKGKILGRKVLSFILTATLVLGLMPGNMMTVSAEGTDTVISDELIVESVSSNDASSATECTCGTDDPAFHATNCPAYIAPENPQCYCAEKCTDDTLNVWCDVCGMQGVSACQGTDTAVTYTDVVASITNGETVTNYATFDDALANWTDGTTLTLLADVTGLTERIKTYAKGLILDLNGHKIECSDNWTIWIDGDSGSELTIRDSQDGGYIQGVVYAVAGGSKLCLESGTVETVSANGDFTMTGGQIISENGSGLSVNAEVDVVISGGEIYGSNYGVWISTGNVTISGDTKITGVDQYAIRSSSSAEVVISGTPTISGGAGEFWLYEQITLNTQPANGEVWRVKINTEEITDGIFAVPGEGIALDASKFASAMDGYDVKQNAKGELLLCNHQTAYAAVSNEDGSTHKMLCCCRETTVEESVACSGFGATCQTKAVCAACGQSYGETNPDVHTFNDDGKCVCGAERDAATTVDLSSLTATYVISDSGEYIFTGTGSYGIKVESGNPKIVLNNVNISLTDGDYYENNPINGIHIATTGGTTEILVLGESSITAKAGAGIFVAEGGTVKITGSSREDILIATGASGCSGIGGYVYYTNGSVNCGNIEISNVTVKAFGSVSSMGDRTPAIGGAGNGNCGYITIDNADVYAEGYINPYGYEGSSAIGTGVGWGNREGGTIGEISIINDSKVYVTRGNYCDYIGCCGHENAPAEGVVDATSKSSTIYCYDTTDTTKPIQTLKYGALGGLLKEDGTCEGEHTGIICDNCGYCSCTHEGVEPTYALTEDGSRHTATWSCCGYEVTEEHSWNCEPDEANTNKMTFSCTIDGCTKGGTITVTGPEGAIYDGNNHTATVTVETEENEELIAAPEITYTSLTEGVELVDGKPVNAGTYKASITLGEVTAYDEFEIAKATPDNGTVSAEDMENTLDISDVVLSRTDDTISGTLSLKEGTELAYGTNDYTYVFKSGDANYNDVEGTVSITIKDTNAPTATYKVGTDEWKQFINAITFGHFCKDNATVDITYSDEESGVADKQYYITEEEITNTENIHWSDYTDTLKINATGKYYIYVRVTDNYGNVVIQNSEGIVVYAESVIAPTSFSCEYGEENSLDVDISTNGNTFAKLTDGSGNEIATENYSIAGSTLTIKGEYLSDLDVGEYTYKICMNPQGVENTEVTLAYSFVVKVTAKELTVTGATATSRAYIANDKTVDITGITLSGIQGTDDVSVEITGLKGTLSSANAGTYTSVTLPTLTLTGDDASNYFIAASAENVSLTTPVTISKAAAPTLSSGSKEYMYHQRFEGESVSITGLPNDCGGVEYVLLGVSGDMLEIVSIDANGKITYNVKALDSYTEGLQGTISVNVKMDNYNDAFYTLDVTRRDKYAVTVKDGMSVSLETNELTYGQMLGGLAFNEVTFVGEAGEVVAGILMWEEAALKPEAGTTNATWVFTPDNEEYAVKEGSVAIVVNKATPNVTGVPTVADRVYNPSAVLADSDLTGGTVKGVDGNSLAGTWSWVDSDTVPTVVNDGYEGVFTPADANYETVTGTITVTVVKATPDIGTVSVLDAELENTTDISMVVLKRTDESMAGTLELTAEALLYGAHGYVWEFTPQDLNNYEVLTGTVAIEVKDTIAPVASYKIGTGDWESFGTSTTYETFSKERLSVEIKAEDSGSGIASVQYYVAPEEIPDVSYIPGWTDYTEAITLDIDRTYVIYVEVTDNGGNKVILNSEGIVIYEDSEITTPELTHTYKEEADEEAVLNLNANTFAKITDAQGTELEEDSDYIVTEDSGTLSIEMQSEYLATLDAGEHTYYVSVNPQGVETTEVTLAYSFVVKVTAKELTVTGATATSRAYIANDKTVNITGITLSGIQGTDDVSVNLTGVKGTLSSDNAGTYTSLTLPALTLTGADKGNYELVQPTGPVTVLVGIEKLNAEIIVEDLFHGKIFGQPPFSLGVSDNNPEAEVTYKSDNEDVATVTSEGIVTIHKAGSALITVSLAESTNYISAESKQIIVDVAKKDGYTVDTIQRNYLYSRENADTIDLSAYLPADCGEVTYGTPDVRESQIFSVAPAMNGSVLGYSVAAGEVSDAAQITVTVKSENYADFTITVEPVLVEWLPVSPKTEVTLTNDTITYGDALSEMSFEEVVFEDEAGNAVAGTLAWKEATLKPEAGTTSATWVFTPDNEEYAVKEGSVAIVVKKATPVVVVPTVAERVYNPSAVLADSELSGGSATGVDGNDLNGSWSWKVSGTVPVVNNSGYEAVFTPVDINNYETVTETIRVKVNQATPVIAQVNGTTITYGDSLAASTVSGQAKHSDSVDMAVAGSFSWKDTTVKPAVADSDTTAFEVVFTPADSVNYKAVETTAKITVNKAPAAPNKPESSLSVPYTTDTVGETDLPAGWTWQNGETALEVGVVCNAVAVYTGTDAGNYETESVTVAITRAACVHDGETELRDEEEESCTEDGYTGDTYCLICEEKLATGEAIPATGHKDADKNHVCDNGCNVAQGTCEDTDKDHDCDYGCDKVFGTCEDTDKDHACDYGCDKVFGTCEDTDKDHDCDYGCDKVYGTCEDVDKDHACDYGCDKVYGTCEDADKDHACDYGCDKVYGTCEDADKDHDCDYGCDKVFGTCEDTDKDHTCDYGCDKAFGTCEDIDKDHDCDYGCDKAFGTHEAASGKHICEYCGKAVTSCKDDNHDHVCDICGEELEHSFLTEWKYDEDGHWHVCSCGLKKDEATHSFTSQITKQPTVHAEGERTYTCSECEYSYKEPIEKLKETPTPAPNTTPIPTDPGKPFIQDDTGKIGWEAIRGETGKAKEGETIIVDMNGTTSVPGAVFDDIKGKNITITLDMGTGVSWTINGKDITANKVNDINFEVKVGTKDNPINTIPVEVINKITGERYFVNISLTHDGELGLKAILNINLDKKNAGLFANLFYYNEKYERMQFIWADDIDEYGTAHLVFTHASEYSIVIDKNIMKDSTTVTSPRTADEERNMPTVLLISALLSLSAGYGCFYTAYRRRKRRR